MKNTKSVAGHAVERVLYLTSGLIVVIGLITAEVAPDFLEDPFLAEDGILEWMSVLLLLFLSGLCLWRAFRLHASHPAAFFVSLLVMALASFFVAGEELSWGQRIFMVETPEWLSERNSQGETNLHNLVLADMSVNEVIFGNLLIFGLFIYMFPLPWLAGRWPGINALVERFALPLPGFLQAVLFLLALALPEALIASDQADEMMEACGLLVLVAIFVWPKNGHVFTPSQPLTDAAAA